MKIRPLRHVSTKYLVMSIGTVKWTNFEQISGKFEIPASFQKKKSTF